MNATVTMPVGELDKLRSDLKEAQDKVNALEKDEKLIKVVRYNIAAGRAYTIKSGNGTHQIGSEDLYAKGTEYYYDQCAEKVIEKRNVEDIKELLRSEIEDKYRQQLNEYSAKNSRLDDEFRKLKERLDEITFLLKDSEEEITKKAVLIVDLRESIKGREAEINNLESIVESKIDQINNLTEDADSLRYQLLKEKQKKGFWSFLNKQL